MYATRSILTVLAATLMITALASCQDAQSDTSAQTIPEKSPQIQSETPQKTPTEPAPVQPKTTKPTPAEPKTAPVKDDSKPGPILTVENNTHDFGKSGPSKRLNCEYSFKNTGTETLKIIKLQTTCGCTLPKIVGGEKMADKSTLFKPGESGKVTLVFTTPNFEGPVTKHLYIISDDKENPRFELIIKATIEFSVVTTPKSFNLSLKKENAGLSPITIKSKDGKPFAITGFSTMRNAITAKYDRKEKATQFTINPQVDMTKLQQAMNGNITINIDHPDTRIVRISYNTKPLFSINRPVIIIQRAEPNKAVTKDALIISNYGGKVEIESIDESKGYAKITKQESLGDRIKLQITITPPPKKAPTSRTFLDKITIKLKGSDTPLVVNVSGYYTRSRK